MGKGLRMTDSALDVARRVSEYWANVDSSGGVDTCHPWTGYINEDGYGEFGWDGRMVGAHELAVTFTTGERRLPELDTCHSCNNPPCCNARHVRFDTRQSNVDDAVLAGTHYRPIRRLSDDAIVLLRRRREAGAPLAVLARDYGISESYASMIATGRKFAEVGGPIQTIRQYRRAS